MEDRTKRNNRPDDERTAVEDGLRGNLHEEDEEMDDQEPENGVGSKGALSIKSCACSPLYLPALCTEDVEGKYDRLSSHAMDKGVERVGANLQKLNMEQLQSEKVFLKPRIPRQTINISSKESICVYLR